MTDGEAGAITARDLFATSLVKDEIGDFIYRNLSREAQAKILGEEYPDEPHKDEPRAMRIAFQIERFKWEMRLHAKLRYMMADVMLAERAAALSEGDAS